MKSNSPLGILFSIITFIFLFFVGADVQSEAIPRKLYKVYLNGETIGLIESEDNLVKLIDEKQNEVKEKYNVDKVYPPYSLEIKEEYTYQTNINTSEEIYDVIRERDPFTINGYVVTIDYPEDEPLVLNVLEKEDFEEAFKSVIKAFVGSDEYEAFASETQEEIVDVGSKIETIYWEEEISIKETLISVDSFIFENSSDISKYLLYGSLDEQEKYVIKEGDDIKSVAYKNNLSTEEFLISNPNFSSENVLLSPNQVVNIGLIKPLVTITNEMHVVEDVIERYEVEYIDDENAYYGTQKTIQEGVDGIKRVTEKVLYRNGEIHDLVVIKNLTVEIKPRINKIISRGVKRHSSGGFQYYAGIGSWLWPATNPSIITSRFGPRWGTHHNGIDVSGPGMGSPIYASLGGKVTATKDGCASLRDDRRGDKEYSSCGGGYGNYVKILTTDGRYTVTYAHLVPGLRVELGQNVARGTFIGGMGNSGSSTGTHLHFEIFDNVLGRYLDPCGEVFRC